MSRRLDVRRVGDLCRTVELPRAESIVGRAHDLRAGLTGQCTDDLLESSSNNFLPRCSTVSSVRYCSMIDVVSCSPFAFSRFGWFNFAHSQAMQSYSPLRKTR
jgi:hypothetical protein